MAVHLYGATTTADLSEPLTGRQDRDVRLVSEDGLAVIVSNVDLTSGLLGTQTWGVYGFEPDYAQSLVENVIFWTVDGKEEGGGL